MTEPRTPTGRAMFIGNELFTPNWDEGFTSRAALAAHKEMK